MPRRVLAFLLSLTMLWCALGTIESPQAFDALSSSAVALAQPAAGEEAAAQGSVEEHHLDDLPSQVTPDPAGDPCLLPHLPRTATSSSPGWQTAGALSAPPGPCLAGPLRPPRPTAASLA